MARYDVDVAVIGAVTLLGRNRQVAPSEDQELATLLARHLRDEGIDVHTGAVARRGGRRRVHERRGAGGG